MYKPKISEKTVTRFRFAKIKLPTTEAEIRQLTKIVCEAFNFEDVDHATYIICQSINRLPADVGWSSTSHFADCIRRSLAAKAAHSLGNSIAPDLQFRELSEYFKQDPTDQQVRDQLHAMAGRGHAKAIEFLKSVDDYSESTGTIKMIKDSV